MLLIWHYESKRQERKWRNKTAKQTTKQYGRKLLSEDEAFCISRSRSFPLTSEQSKVFCALFQWCLQNCNASARAGPRGAVQYFGWEHNTAEGKGGDDGSWPSVLHYGSSRPQQPQAESSSNSAQRLQQPSQQNADGPKHHDFIVIAKDYPTSSKRTFGATALSHVLSALCSRPYW